MKIGLVSPYDYPYKGGVNEHIAHLEENFRRLGHTVRIIAPSSSAESELATLDGNIYRIGGIVSIPTVNGSVARITLSPLLSRRVKAFLEAEQFDVIHYHEPLMPILPVTVLHYARRITPHTLNVATFHAYDESNVGYAYARPLLKRLLNRLDGRIAVSKPARDFVSQYFPADYTIIPNGVSLKQFDQDVLPLSQYRDGKLNILFVGRFGEQRKGLKYLLRALVYIRQQFPQTRLIIVGQGPKAGYERYLARHGITDVVWAGFISDEEKARYFATADIFCAPSTGGESFGIVLAEAMAAGKPIVASNIPGYASVITNGVEGFLFEPKNVENLAMALIHLLASADVRHEMGAAGLKTVAGYSWEKVTQRVLSFYEDARRFRQHSQRSLTGQTTDRPRVQQFYSLGSRLLLGSIREKD